MRPREVFISHASADRRRAERVVRGLARHRIRFWYSRSRLVGAQAWHDEIGKALARCDWFLVLLTPAAVRSDWVKHELTSALTRKRYRNRIVPVLLKTCRHDQLSFTLAGMQMVDFRRNFQAGLCGLLGVWGVKPKGAEQNR